MWCLQRRGAEQESKESPLTSPLMMENTRSRSHRRVWQGVKRTWGREMGPHPHLQRVGTSQQRTSGRQRGALACRDTPKAGISPVGFAAAARGGGNVTAAGAGVLAAGRDGVGASRQRGGGGRGPLSREYGKHVRITCGRLPPAAARGPSEGGAGPRSAARRRERGHFKRPPGATASPCPARSMR